LTSVSIFAAAPNGGRPHSTIGIGCWITVPGVKAFVARFEASLGIFKEGYQAISRLCAEEERSGAIVRIGWAGRARTVPVHVLFCLSGITIL
jgi:hypothetical protein